MASNFRSLETLSLETERGECILTVAREKVLNPGWLTGLHTVYSNHIQNRKWK